MEKIKLEVKSRSEIGRKTNKGRKLGMIPAVVYGKGISSENLWVNNLSLEKLLKKSGESIIIDLNIEGKDDRNVIIHEIQKNPVTEKYTHIDFFQVNMSEKIETEVELVFVGESPAVKELGGVLVKSIDKLHLKCLPADLPSHIDIDISAIKSFDDHIAVKDIKISDKVELLLDLESVIASVAAPRTEEELNKLEEKVEGDVTKVEGVVKPEKIEEEAGAKKEDKK